ncbi:hypothetical protein F5146DRAFT_999570 [Armillaria mellea]|nr:hypothetical protein F5146DRAFT_999570 [Armillaria mellea]
MYLITNDELEILMEFSWLLYFGNFYISITSVPVSYPIFCEIVNQANFIINAAPLSSDSSTHDVHGKLLRLEHFFSANDPFLTNTIEDQLLKATTNAMAWMLEELRLLRMVAKAKVDMHNLHKQAEALKSMCDKVLGSKRGQEDEDNSVGAKKAKKGDKSTHHKPLSTGKWCSKPKGFIQAYGLEKSAKVLMDMEVKTESGNTPGAGGFVLKSLEGVLEYWP